MESSKVLSPNQILAGSFWGGPIAAVYYLRRNYIALGKDDYAQKTLAYGIIIIVFLLGLLPFLPEKFPNMILPLAYSFAAMQLATSTQLRKQMIEESDEYEFESNFKIFGVGLVTLVFFLVSVALVIMMFESAGFVSLS